MEKELEKMKKLAMEIMEEFVDMDFMDYEDTIEDDMENLVNDLEILEKYGNGSLVNAIKQLLLIMEWIK